MLHDRALRINSLGRRELLAGAIASAAAAAASGRSVAPSAPFAQTRSGSLRGRRERGVQAFKGIPYGETTAGDWRFRAPRPAAAWTGIRQATAYGTIAPQGDAHISQDFQSILHYRELAPPGEDCLRLNVWTPSTAAGHRPVMVWFHGGGFSSGSGGIPLYDGANLAREQDVVVVTVNHRLAAFGYLDLAWTGDKRFEASANAGNLDLILALEWVRDNIAAFGGDPNNVTIFGQSGGGAKVATVMAMPAARGLFHKAIIQSGAMLRARSRAQSEQTARAFLDALGLKPDDVHKLATMPLATLYKAEQVASGSRLDIWGPVVDGVSLPRDPFDPDAPPMVANIPLLIGSTEQETTLFDAFLNRDPMFGKLDGATLRQRAAGLWGCRSDAMMTAYRIDYPGLSDWNLWVRMKSDAFAGNSSINLAERKARQPASVYVYRLSWQSPVYGGRLGAFHGLDQPLIFDNLDLSPGWAGTGPRARTLAERMSKAWASFARHGSPDTDLLPEWRTYRPDRRSVMILDDKCRLVEDPAPQVRQAWSNLPAAPFAKGACDDHL